MQRSPKVAACWPRIWLVALAVVATATANGPAAARLLTDGFVGCSTYDNCYPFDLQTHVAGDVISLLPDGDYPYDATITPDGSQVWFVGASGDGVVVFDRATNTVAASFRVAEYAIGVAFNKDGSRAMVTSRDDRCVKIVDTATYAVIGSLAIPSDYQGAGNIALNPVTGTFYVVDWYNDFLYEIAADGSAILRQDDFGTSLWQVVVAPDGQHVYVTDRSSDQVKEIDTATFTITREFPVGDDSWGLDITGDGATLAVACEDSHEVMLIDLASGTVTAVFLAATADPRDVDILDAAGLAYVTGGTVTGFTGPVYVIDLATAAVVDTFDGPGTNSNVIAVQAQMHGGTTAVQTPAVPLAMRAYPNPFNPSVTVELRLAEPATGTLAIHDLAGRLVRTLISGDLGAGVRHVVWDGRDQTGRALPSGVYLARLATGGRLVTQKLVLAQ